MLLLVLGILIHCGGTGGPGDRTSLSREALTDSVRAGIVRSLEPYTESLVEVHDLPGEVEIPRSGVTVRVNIPRAQRPRGSMQGTVDVMTGGTVLTQLPVRLVIRTFGDILVAGRRLDRHAEVAEGDIVVQRAETTRWSEEPVRNHSQLKGLRLRRMVTAGTPLVRTLFEQTPLVVMGGEVNLVVTAGSVRVATPGIAREDGALGDLITVRPKGSREWVRGRVVDATTVAMVVY